MSLVPQTQQSNHLNGASANGVIAPVPALKDGFEPLGHPNLGATPTFDFWGLLRRRIYLIALFAIVGAALGYLNYVKSPKVYSSGTRLLITTQAPPSIVNGNILLNQKSSIPNHTSLLASEMVLSSAIKHGNLDKLDTFSATANEVGLLKSMIRVIPEGGDSLNLVCTGSRPEDLPIILNQIVESYRRVVVDDSQSVSEQTVSLIEALAREMGDEKDDLESNRMKLRSELDVTAINASGAIVNPYTRNLEELRRTKDSLFGSSSDLKLRREQLLDAITVDKESGELDRLQVEVAAIEAREFLKIARTDFLRAEQPVEMLTNDLELELNTLKTRIWGVESAISDLRASMVGQAQIVGPGHRNIDSLEQQIKYRQKEMAKLRTKLETIRDALSKSRSENTDARKQLDELELQENKNWIRMYHLALVKEEKAIALKLELLDKSIEKAAKNATAASEKIFEYNVIQKAINKKEQAVDVILDRLKEINVLADNYTMTKIRTLQEPKPGGQIAPSFSKCLMFATLLSSLLGLGLAFLVDQADMSFRSPSEVLAHLNLPVVGKIPRIRTKRIKASKGCAELITAHNPASSESEAFRNIRTNLFFRSANEDLKVILLTSPSPGDGKSTTAANLAISIAQAGKRVCLVDADFRRPRIDRYFGEELENGFMDVLEGFKKLKDVVKTTELQQGLHLITAGGHPKNPGELVTSPEFRKTLATLRKSFDFVVVDSPPVLAVSDSISIASHVDGVYLVSRIRKGVKLTARRAKSSLDSVNAVMLGLIVNDLDQNPYYHEYGYQYRNYAYYGSGTYRTYYDSEQQGSKQSRIMSSSKTT